MIRALKFWTVWVINLMLPSYPPPPIKCKNYRLTILQSIDGKIESLLSEDYPTLAEAQYKQAMFFPKMEMFADNFPKTEAIIEESNNGIPIREFRCDYRGNNSCTTITPESLRRGQATGAYPRNAT